MTCGLEMPMCGWHLGDAKTAGGQWAEVEERPALRNTRIERAEGGGGPERNDTSSQRPRLPRTAGKCWAAVPDAPTRPKELGQQ